MVVPTAAHGRGSAGLVALSLAQRLSAETSAPAEGRARIPPVFWLFAAVLVAYGVCETLFGNWGPTLLRDGGTASTTANYALAAFWAAVTVGRLLISIVPKRIPSGVIYLALPWGSQERCSWWQRCRTTRMGLSSSPSPGSRAQGSSR